MKSVTIDKSKGSVFAELRNKQIRTNELDKIPAIYFKKEKNPHKLIKFM